MQFGNGSRCSAYSFLRAPRQKAMVSSRGLPRATAVTTANPFILLILHNKHSAKYFKAYASKFTINYSTSVASEPRIAMMSRGVTANHARKPETPGISPHTKLSMTRVTPMMRGAAPTRQELEKLVCHVSFSAARVEQHLVRSVIALRRTHTTTHFGQHF